MDKLNRALVLVALVIGIIWLLLSGFLTYRLLEIGNTVQGALDRLQHPAEQCWDPGGGTVCAPGGPGD